MIIYPAIDLKDGKAVRLTKGDYDRMDVYHSDPMQALHGFIRQGATHLHMVDLDGAKDGSQVNLQLVRAACALNRLFIEVGGGARDENSVRAYLDAGVDRVILGTLAVTDPKLTERLAKLYPGRIAVGVDAKDGLVAIRGWREITKIDAMAFACALPDRGIDATIYTDISRDGMMMGANLSVYQDLAKVQGLKVIASGGVSSYEDIRTLRDMGIHGAIIGKALYEGRLDLARAIEIAGGEAQ